ncbi:hypothetical protein [Rhodococcus aetherivorans]|uniref:hypothetical protein n=1 Tax=Rhodococcus aetherivorans TaxID=191292 RepID=UPI00294A4841|nr:hypothetical protein [Rhodococcus aetherivorans]MDV6295181.1 hypothetical protein [Rhodococcus aetherivorans]
MANKINIKIEALDNASKPIKGVANELENGSNKATKFDGAMASLGGTLVRTATAAGIAGLAAGGAGAVIGFKFNSSVEQAETKLMAFMQSQERVAKTMKWVKDEAAKTQFSFTDMADAAAQLTPTANVSGIALEDLVRQAEVLAAINPAEGLSGAAFSLREALSNDWVSIVERFNLPRARINQLKEEGVPAMEAIKRVLKEMGIDYGLVAAQGQTVSARFDQVKDKLTMMAGAATKPIFDRVSKELDTLGKFDYAALGNQMAGVVSGAIKAFDDFVPKVQEVGGKIGNYLSPKIIGLWATIQEKLIPSLVNTWNTAKPLATGLGVVLVGAIGATIDVLKGTISVVSALSPVILGGVAAWAAYRGVLIASNAAHAVHSAWIYLTGTRYVVMNGAIISVTGTTTAATLAQAAWNTVLAMNPIGLVIGAVVGLTTALGFLMFSTDSTVSATDRLNEARRQQQERADAARDAENKLTDAHTGVERATLNVEQATKNYNTAVETYGSESLEARTAALNLKDANKELEDSTWKLNSALSEQMTNLDTVNRLLDNLNGKNVKYSVSEDGSTAAWKQNGKTFFGGGFATGGFTGRGGVNEVAGAVHKGEYVLPHDLVNQSTGQPDLGKVFSEFGGQSGRRMTPTSQSGDRGGHSVNLNGDIIINNGGDYRRMLSDIGFALELAS